jgi:predicted nucleotidyltransferase
VILAIGKTSDSMPGQALAIHPWRVTRRIMAGDRRIERLLRQAERDPSVLAVIVFGSAARGDFTAESDIDVCLVLPPGSDDRLSLSQKRLAYLENVDLDVCVFQQLPLYIRVRVLKEGKVLLSRDDDLLYELAFRTARAFEDFKPRYHAYLAEVARGGS